MEISDPALAPVGQRRVFCGHPLSWVAGWAAVLLLAAGPIAASLQTPLYFDPVVRETTVGTIFDVAVYMGDVTGLASLDLQIDFDPTLLAAVDADVAAPGTQVAPGEVLAGGLAPVNTVDNALGRITYSVESLTPFTRAGQSIVFTATFSATAIGESPLSFSLHRLGDSSLVDIAHTVQDGTVSVGAAATETPSPTSTATETPEPAPTDTVAATLTATNTDTPTASQTPTPSGTATSADASPTATAIATVLQSLTATPGDSTPTPTSPPTAPVAAGPLHLPLLLKTAPSQGPTATPSSTLSQVGTATRTATPRSTPSATSTGLGSPSTTATQTRWPSASPTATATETQSAFTCYEVIELGGFEASPEMLDAHWHREVTPRRATYTDQVAHSPTRSVSLGIQPGEPLALCHSTLYTRDRFIIPANAVSTTLGFWWKRGTQETRLPAQAGGAPSQRLGAKAALDYYADVHEVLLLDPQTYRPLAVLERALANDAGWVMASHDLTPWRGRSVVVYFGVFNTNYGGRTWMYVDDVSLTICVPRAATS